MNKGERKVAEDLISCLPDNWLDSLLTGDNAVLHGKVGEYDCMDIERLINGIRKRMEDKLGL